MMKKYSLQESIDLDYLEDKLVKYAKDKGLSASRAENLTGNILGLFETLITTKYESRIKVIFEASLKYLYNKLGINNEEV